MKNASWRKFLLGGSIRRDLDELKDTAIRYVKEETIKPIKELGRFIVWGLAGSIFFAFGVVLVLIGSLRYLQWQFPVFQGSLSWIPYLIVAFLALAVIGLTVKAIVNGAAKRRLKPGQ